MASETTRRLLRCRSMLAIAVLLVVSSCGGSSPATSGGAIPTDRASLIGAFPADVQSVFTSDVPTEVIAALLRIRRAGPNTLIFDDDGGALVPARHSAYISNWEKITGWTVQDVAPDVTAGQLKAAVDSGQTQWDIIEPGDTAGATLMQEQGLLDKLDTTLLSSAFASEPKQAGWRHTDYWYQWNFTGVMFIWDTRKWPLTGTHPTSPDDLFNTSQFPGKRCLENYPDFGGTLEYPLLADGVPFSKLYPLDVQRAFNKLSTIKSQIVWWDSGAASIQNIVQGNCAMGVTWAGRVSAALADDPSAPIGWTWNKTIMIDGSHAIPKGAPHAAAANSLIAYALTPQNQCKFINLLGYGVPMDETCINANGKKFAATATNTAMTVGYEDANYYAHNLPTLIDKFNAWITS